MPTPVETQIMDAVGLRLQSIKETNGYSTTVESIDRARLTPFKNGDLPAINYWPIAEALVERIHHKEKRRFSFSVEYHDKTRDYPFSDVAFLLKTDVLTALWRTGDAPAVSDTPSSALGGIVSSLVLDSSIPAIGEGQSPVCGVVLEFTATYFIDPSNPFTLYP